MARKTGPFFRMFLVAAIGGGLAALAVGSGKPRFAAALSPEQPPTMVLAISSESAPPQLSIENVLPEHCLLPPRESKDQQAADKKADERPGRREKKKIIACG